VTFSAVFGFKLRASLRGVQHSTSGTKHLVSPDLAKDLILYNLDFARNFPQSAFRPYQNQGSSMFYVDLSKISIGAAIR